MVSNLRSDEINNWVEFICALQDQFLIPINEAPMESPTKVSKIQEPINHMQEIRNPPKALKPTALATKIAFED